MSVFDKVRSNAVTESRRESSDGSAGTEHVCVFCRRDFDPNSTRACPGCGAELLYRGER